LAPDGARSLIEASAPVLSVGILSADLGTLDAEVKVLESAGVELVHVDVMDGCFTPMMTVGPPLVRALETRLLKDVHLMIDEPLAKVPQYVAAGADIVTVHVESTIHVHRVLQELGRMVNANDPARGIVRGVALNPGTPVACVEPVLDEIELVLLLAVNPGWSGQRFIPATFERLARVREIAARAPKRILIGVDGGITHQNVSEVARAGADLIVTGSAVFDGGDAAGNARAMIRAARTH
jgi:ribulose-phosphate 3-epimerase